MSRILKFAGDTWPEIAVDVYKDEPGTWIGTTRRVLVDGEKTEFQTRYFEVAPGGYTSFERHEHEHVVVVLTGNGQVRLGNELAEIELNDCIHVSSNEPHQFINNTQSPLGILCIVNKDRDRPVILNNDASPRTSE
jgi:quercetin dioxygenase-like cupin family protein